MYNQASKYVKIQLKLDILQDKQSKNKESFRACQTVLNTVFSNQLECIYTGVHLNVVSTTRNSFVYQLVWLSFPQN